MGLVDISFVCSVVFGSVASDRAQGTASRGVAVRRTVQSDASSGVFGFNASHVERDEVG